MISQKKPFTFFYWDDVRITAHLILADNLNDAVAKGTAIRDRRPVKSEFELCWQCVPGTLSVVGHGVKTSHRKL